ncbi:hypothetical protein [Actinoplanes sp. TFC3]|uniref:hypothetical protein n=1 Tax=Actinoplanes sp. TFC3 TaxID=1710355 RepID=UPI0008372CF7|nr:hypothetical protein [Actinoplanes sp. TFC3]
MADLAPDHDGPMTFGVAGRGGDYEAGQDLAANSIRCVKIGRPGRLGLSPLWSKCKWPMS